MNAEPEQTGWRRTPGWVKLSLVLSLLVNVAVIGLAGGTAIRHWQEGPNSGRFQNEPGLDRSQSRILRMVPEARREEAREILLSRQEEYQVARETMRTAQQSLIEALRQEPPDPDRLATILAERRAASGQAYGIGYEQMVEIALRLNAEERAEMAERLEERMWRWMERQAKKGS
jgi:uncharacterized membrane protein